MRASSAKAKGRRLQQEIRDSILAAFPALEPDDVRAAVMGESGEDLKFSPAARRLFPYSVEAKNQERLNIWQAIHQAESNAGEFTPLVVFRKNRQPARVVLSWDHFLELVTR